MRKEELKMLIVMNTGVNRAFENMRFDSELLKSLREVPILHLYEWEGPSATYGYFIRPEKHLDLKRAAFHRIELAKRPTGGGIVFHIWDLAFSFLMPSSHPGFSENTLDNYRFVNEAVKEAVKQLLSLQKNPEIIRENFPSKGDSQNFCMAKPTKYDVVLEGMKIAGAAQRKTKQGYLHQGTISLAVPQEHLLRDVLLSKTEVLQAMLRHTFSPLGRVWEPKRLKEARRELEQILREKLVEKLAVFG